MNFELFQKACEAGSAIRMRALRHHQVGSHLGSQVEFARRLGIEQRRWSNIENGSPVSREIAQRLVWFCRGVDFNFVFEGGTDGMTVKLANELNAAAREVRNSTVTAA